MSFFSRFEESMSEIPTINPSVFFFPNSTITFVPIVAIGVKLLGIK
jgi:hypothetical protein